MSPTPDMCPSIEQIRGYLFGGRYSDSVSNAAAGLAAHDSSGGGPTVLSPAAS